MTPYDLIPLALFGLMFLGARRLDRLERERVYESLCKTSSISPSSWASSSSPKPTSADATGSGPTNPWETRPMRDPRFRYYRGLP